MSELRLIYLLINIPGGFLAFREFCSAQRGTTPRAQSSHGGDELHHADRDGYRAYLAESSSIFVDKPVDCAFDFRSAPPGSIRFTQNLIFKILDQLRPHGAACR